MYTSESPTYEAPTLNRIGSFEEVTLGGQFSGSIDGFYPIGTPSTTPVFS